MLPSTLEELNINIPGVVGVAEMMKKFEKLRKLGLYDPYSKNLEIQSNTFVPLQQIPIQELRIRAGSLSYIHPRVFTPFFELETLDLSESKGMEIADLYPSLIGLNVTKLKLSSFTRSTHNSKLELVILNGTFMNALAGIRRLVDLQMDNAEIYSIQDTRKHLTQLINLQKLNISFNFISMKDIAAIDWTRLRSLRDLDISHQMFITSDIKFRVELALPSNLSKLCMSHIRRLDDNLPIEVVISDPTRTGNFEFPEKSVDTLKIVVVLGQDPFFNVHFNADFSSNNMVSFNGSSDKSRHNRFLVRGLLLQRNTLGKHLGENGEEVFKHFKHLKKLDLSSNDIKHLPYSTFENQQRLKFLNLSKNSIISVTFKIFHFKNIQIIDLSDNLISQFNQKLQADMDSLKAGSPNFTINMLGNPIQCSCETHTFLWWMYHKRSMFTQFNEYTCIYNNELMKFENMRRLLDNMDFQCSKNLIMKLAAGLLAFVIFMVALSVFVYRHKWDVKFFCLRFITDRKAYQELQDDDTEYEYDAFVSYHKDDRGWVRNELHENIDMRDGEVDTIGQADQPRFRLCIHDRDFIPGEAIEKNILKAIESSRKTIIVLSRNFLKSAWCEFELQIARKECVEKGRNLIIAVMLEPLSVDDKMSRSVERLIRKNTYIEWNEDSSQREQFWNKLRAALNV